jgi:Xaa-Pro aminopeptidase
VRSKNKTSARFLQLKKIFLEFDFVDVSSLILEQRKQKDVCKIEMIKEACKVIDAGHEAVLSNLGWKYDYLVDNIEIGMKCEEIFRMAMEKAKELNVEEYFLRLGNRQAHFLGHGIGLELNEPPLLSEYDHSKVSEGFVVTLEIHMMDGKNMVKLEDMLLISEKRNKILNKTPRELFQV